MWRWFLTWLATWALFRLEREAFKMGALTLQQTQLENGHGWSVSLRAHQAGGKPRYCWTGSGSSVASAIKDVLKTAKDNEIGSKPVLPHAPRLGGKAFDEWE